jgi:hypothetical protein
MAADKTRRVEGPRKVVRPKTQDLNADAAMAIPFGISRRPPDSIISMLPYARNEGMPEVSVHNKGSTPDATQRQVQPRDDHGGFQD